LKSIKFAIHFIKGIMSRVCQISGKKAMVGNNVSHSNKKTKRRFNINLIKKKFYIPSENKWVTLKVTASTLKTIDKKGISEVLKLAKEKGLL
jgi:large subunit ribosomal protein L28